MRHLLSAALASVGVLALLASGEARAQSFGQSSSSSFQRPTVSPYLNLGRSANNPAAQALNYQTLVRPANDVYNSLNQLGQQSSSNRQGILSNQEDIRGIIGTGHPIRFMYYTQYFQNLGGPQTQQGQRRQGQQPQQASSGGGSGRGRGMGGMGGGRR